MNFIEEKDGRLVINFLLFKAKFNLKAQTNVIYFKSQKGKLKKIKRLPKGLYVKFHGYNSKLIIEDKDIFGINCTFHIFNNSHVEIRKMYSYRATDLYIEAKDNSSVIIDEGFNCAGVNIIAGSESTVKIGKGCMFSNDVYIRSDDSHKIFDIETHSQINKPENINIGDNVWLGHNVTVLKGVTIPNNTIVGTNSTVTKSFDEPNTIIAGMPAKVIKKGIYWER